MVDFSRFERFAARKKNRQRHRAEQAPESLSVADKQRDMANSQPPRRQTSTSSGTVTQQITDLSHRRGQQQQQVDRQIWHLHARMVDKLLAEPALFAPLPEKLEQARQQGLLRHSEYLFWHCAFSLFDDAAAFRDAILSLQPGPCKYRRRTRLVGILTEAERVEILQQPATLPDQA